MQAPVAQWIEQGPPKTEVVGSTPAWGIGFRRTTHGFRGAVLRFNSLIRPHFHYGFSFASVCLPVYFSRILSDIVISLSMICEEMMNLFWVNWW
jgi:hypothetical protein